VSRCGGGAWSECRAVVLAGGWCCCWGCTSRDGPGGSGAVSGAGQLDLIKGVEIVM